MCSAESASMYSFKGILNSLTLEFLRQQAQENLQKHIHETVPEEYQKCMLGINRNLKQTLEIRDNPSDPKVKLQAAAIANDCYKFILGMTTCRDCIRRFEICYIKDRTAKHITKDRR